MRKHNHFLHILCVAAVAASLSACGMSQAEADYRNQGIIYLQDGNYEAAVDAFQSALDQVRGTVSDAEIDICYYKAEAQYLNGSNMDALETYSAIIAYNDDSRAHFLRGCLYARMGMESESQKDFDAAIEGNPSDYELYIGIHDMLAAEGRVDEADSYLNQALLIKGESATDKVYKGRIEYMLGQYSQAVLHLSEAVEKGNPEGNYYLAQVYLAKNDPTNAESYFQAYLDAGCANSNCLYEMGCIKMGRGDYVGAITHFKDALELESVPNKSAILRKLTIAYEYAGQYSSAKDIMKLYVDMFPNDWEAVRELTFLETRAK